MYGIYANIWGILMVNVTIYSIHGSDGYRIGCSCSLYKKLWKVTIFNNFLMGKSTN